MATKVDRKRHKRELKKRAKKIRLKNERRLVSMHKFKYKEIFTNELLPHKSKLDELTLKEDIIAWRFVDNPSTWENFISPREISLKEHEDDPDYLDIPPMPVSNSQKHYDQFFSEYGLSSYPSFQDCDEAALEVYNRITRNHGIDKAEEFFNRCGHYMVEVIYKAGSGWVTKQNSKKHNHFDFIREPEWDFNMAVTGNYKKLNISWQTME